MPLAGAAIDPDALATALELEFPWIEETVIAMTDDIRLMRNLGQHRLRFRTLLMVGPSGIGPTLMARRSATLAGTGSGLVGDDGSFEHSPLLGKARSGLRSHPACPRLTSHSCG